MLIALNSHRVPELADHVAAQLPVVRRSLRPRVPEPAGAINYIQAGICPRSSLILLNANLRTIDAERISGKYSL